MGAIQELWRKIMHELFNYAFWKPASAAQAYLNIVNKNNMHKYEAWIIWEQDDADTYKSLIYNIFRSVTKNYERKCHKRHVKMQNKLDGVGPVDNRPSTDKLHHFVWKKEK